MLQQSESENKENNEMLQSIRIHHPSNQYSIISVEENQSQHNLEDVSSQIVVREDSISDNINPHSCSSEDLINTEADHTSLASCNSINGNREDAEQCTTVPSKSVAMKVHTASISTPSSFEKTISSHEIISHGKCYSTSREYNHGQCGLNNLGNTCFMNSILQCVNNIPPLVKHYCDPRNKSWLSYNNHPVSREFANLVQSMRIYDTVRPAALKSAVSKYAPLFGGYGQQDSHEYLTALLDALHQESLTQTEESDSGERSIITDLFQGQMEYTIKCSAASRCQNVTITTDPFLDIPVFIDEAMSPSSSAEIAAVLSNEQARRDSDASYHIWPHTMNILCCGWILLTKCGTLLKSLFTALCWLNYYIIMRMWYSCDSRSKHAIFGNFYRRVSTFTSENPQPCDSVLLEQCLKNNICIVERTSSNSTWFCPHCQRNRQLTKENRILSLPQVLIIHLKRFDMESSSHRKIETFVKYPLELNMTKFLSSPTLGEEHVYDLIGVCLHSGSFERGHYIAYIKKISGWYCFNDSFVNSISVNDVISRNAYILFYLKRAC